MKEKMPYGKTPDVVGNGKTPDVVENKLQGKKWEIIYFPEALFEVTENRELLL